MSRFYLLVLLGFFSFSCTTINTQTSPVSIEPAASFRAFEMSDPKSFSQADGMPNLLASSSQNSGDEPRPEACGVESLLP